VLGEAVVVSNLQTQHTELRRRLEHPSQVTTPTEVGEGECVELVVLVLGGGDQTVVAWVGDEYLVAQMAQR